MCRGISPVSSSHLALPGHHGPKSRLRTKVGEVESREEQKLY